MRTLLLMRHAKSSRDDPQLDDHDRPLDARGLRDAPRMGALLREKGLIPDSIFSSTALRALRTARLVARECRFDKALVATADLYHAGENDLRGQIRQLPADDTLVLCVGHNPGLEDFLASWTGHYVRMPTAAIARLHFDQDAWPDIADRATATLADLWGPKDLPDGD